MKSIGEKYIEELNEIFDKLPERKSALVENPSTKCDKQTIRMAKECVTHYYGLSTDNFIIDISMEIQHLHNFKDRIAECEGDGIVRDTVFQALDSYIKVLETYKYNLIAKEFNDGKK